MFKKLIKIKNFDKHLVSTLFIFLRIINYIYYFLSKIVFLFRSFMLL